jgi:ketosteroid isomerase-like protein
VSQANVELVRRVYEGWARGDFSGIDSFHPEIEFEMVDWPHQIKVRGIAAMSDAWRDTLRAWEDFRSIRTDYVDFGHNILVLNRIEGSGKESGADVSADTATLWTVEDGKVVRLALYWDTQAAREAAAQGSSAG